MWTGTTSKRYGLREGGRLAKSSNDKLLKLVTDIIQYEYNFVVSLLLKMSWLVLACVVGLPVCRAPVPSRLAVGIRY